MGKKSNAAGWDKTFQNLLLYRDGDGKISRIDGPAAITYKDDKVRKVEWFWRGKLHRRKGPAVTYISPTGEKVYMFYIKGNAVSTAKQYQRRARLSDEEVLSIVLKYGEIGRY